MRCMTTARTGNCITPAVPTGTNKEERLTMTEGFRSPPPPSPAAPGGWGDTPASRQQEVTDTVQRIMGEDIAPPPAPVTPPPTPTSGSDGSTSTTDVAKQQTAEVADTAKQAGAQVAGTVKEQAGQVTEEAKHQAKQLLSQAQSELSEQAASTQQRVSEGLHALADELTGMARNSEQDGVATDLARQAADRARTAAGWLADRDPGSLLERGAVLRPPQARHLPGARARRRCPRRPVDPRPDRPHRRHPRRIRRQHRRASTRTDVPGQSPATGPHRRRSTGSADHGRVRLRAPVSRPGATCRCPRTGDRASAPRRHSATRRGDVAP